MPGPSIPVYNRPLVQERAAPNIRVSSDAPAAAFGAGSQQVIEAVGKSFGTVADVVYKAKQDADQLVATEKDTQLSELQTSVGLGVKNLSGRNAGGAEELIQTDWQKGYDEITKDLTPDQKRLVDRTAQVRVSNLKKLAMTHAAAEFEKYDDSVTDASLAQATNQAVQNYQDPEMVLQARIQREQTLENYARRKGLAPEVIADRKLQAASDFNSKVIQQMLAKNDVAAAQNYLAQNRADISGNQLPSIEKAVDDASTITQGMATYASLKGMRLADGSPNLGRMESAIYSDKSLSDEKKMKIASFVKARAAEDFQNRTREHAAADFKFMNDLVTSRKDGIPLETAMKLAGQYGRDPTDQANKEEAVRKLYTANTTEDPLRKQGLWESIQDGTATKDDIDLALKNGVINSGSWAAYRQDFYRVTTEGKSTLMKSRIEQVKILAKQKYGDDPVKSASFLAEVSDAARGKSPDEYFAIAQDKIKEDPTTGSRMWVTGWKLPWGDRNQFETDAERRNATSTAFGKAAQDLGRDTIRALQAGAARTGATQFTPGDLDALSIRFGGYENMKPGTPAYEAMQSLMRKGKPVVEANIREEIKRMQVGQR